MNQSSQSNASRSYTLSTLNLSLYAIICMILPSLIQILYFRMTDTDTMSNSIAYLISFLPMYCIAFPIYLLLGRKIESTPPQKHSLPMGKWIIALCICEAIMLFGNLIGLIISAVFTAIFPDITTTTLNNYVFGEEPYLFLFFAVVCAPIVEEMLFRKVFIDRVRKYGDGWAILCSGLLFGLFHGNFTQFFYAAGIGMFFAFLYVRTGKILHTISLHMTINFLGSAVPALLMDSETFNQLLSNDTANIEELLPLLQNIIPYLLFSFCVWIVAIVGLVLLLTSIRKFELQPAQVPTKAKQVLLNPGVLIFSVLCILLFVINMIWG